MLSRLLSLARTTLHNMLQSIKRCSHAETATATAGSLQSKELDEQYLFSSMPGSWALPSWKLRWQPSLHDIGSQCEF